MTNSKILRSLKGQGSRPPSPRTCTAYQEGVSVCAQGEEPQAQDSKFRLLLIESRIHRLARYYKLAKKPFQLEA